MCAKHIILVNTDGAPKSDLVGEHSARAEQSGHKVEFDGAGKCRWTSRKWIYLKDPKAT